MNEKYKMKYGFNETKATKASYTRTNETKSYRNDSKLNDRTENAEFPSLRLYKAGTYVHKSFLEYPNIRKTDLIKKNIAWAKSVYDLGRQMYPNLLTAEFRLSTLSHKPDMSNVVRYRKTSSFEEDEILMDDARVMFPDMKDLNIAFSICKRLLKVPIPERKEDEIGRLEWAMEVLDVNDDMIRYLLQVIKRISKEEKEKAAKTKVKVPPISVKTVGSINNTASKQNGGNKAATYTTTTATKTNPKDESSTSTSSTRTKDSKTHTTTNAKSPAASSIVTKANSTATSSTSTTFASTKTNSNAVNSTNKGATVAKPNIASTTSTGTTAAVTKANSNAANFIKKGSTAAKPNTAAATSTNATTTVTKANTVSASSANTTSTVIKAISTTAANSTAASSANTTPAVISTGSGASNPTGSTSVSTNGNTAVASSTSTTTTLTKTTAVAASTKSATSTVINTNLTPTSTRKNSTVKNANFAATSASIMSNLVKARAAASNAPKATATNVKVQPAKKNTIPVLISSADTARIHKSTPVANAPKTGSNPGVSIGINSNVPRSAPPRPPYIYNAPKSNMHFPSPNQPRMRPPIPPMNNFQQVRPMYNPPAINAPYPVQAPMNNYQAPYMYHHPPATVTAPYQTVQPHNMCEPMPQYQMQPNYQHSYTYNNPAAQNMSYPNMQPNTYAPNMNQVQPVAPPSAIESQHNYYAPYAYNSTAAEALKPVAPAPSNTVSIMPTAAARSSQDTQRTRVKVSSSSTSKTAATELVDEIMSKTMKSFQSRRNIEDFVNPSNPLTDKLSTFLTDSIPKNVLRKQIIDLTERNDESPLNAKRRRLIEEGLISDPEESNGKIVVGLVDHSAPNGTISTANWNLIKNRLQATLLELLKDDPGSFPNGLDAGWHQGRIKLFAFENQTSLQLFKRAVYKLGNLWPGARITVEPQTALPHRPRYRTYIPVEPSDPAKILKIIQVSNPNLSTSDWEVLQVDGERRGQRCICLVLNAESFEPLLDQGMIITYGFGCIRLKMYKQDKLPHEKEALQVKYNTKKLRDIGHHQQAAISRRKSVSERERAEIEREYRDSFGGKRMREDELTSKLAEDILQHLDQIIDESTLNVPERAEYRNWY